MSSFFRSPRTPKSKSQKVKEKLWYICCSYKRSCSLWMLLLFGLTILYLRDNYKQFAHTHITRFIPTFAMSTITSTTSSTDAEISYLHPLSYKSIGYGTCPFSSPTFPNIGPNIPFMCPSKKRYRASAVWYLQKDVLQNMSEDDGSTDTIDEFFKNVELFKHIVRNNTDTTSGDLQITFKKTSGLNIIYQYVSCQTEADIEKLKFKWNDIIKDDEYSEILSEFGYKSWKDMKICFDKILCVAENYFGGYSFNLYLCEKSQKMLKKLITKTEEIEEKNYLVDLTFKRVEHQQAFHVELASITNIVDHKAFDAKKLMDKINKEMKGKFPCIQLVKEPPFKNEWCYNTKKLKEKSLKFQWKCAEIE
eukprot:438422_1